MCTQIWSKIVGHPSHTYNTRAKVYIRVYGINERIRAFHPPRKNRFNWLALVYIIFGAFFPL